MYSGYLRFTMLLDTILNSKAVALQFKITRRDEWFK